MRFLVFWLLCLFSAVSSAACSDIAYLNNNEVFIEIGDGGCAERENMIYFATKQANGKFGKRGKVSFSSECSSIKGGFKCRPDGKTPLAGATYKSIKFGRSRNSCDDNDAIGEKYICIKGCGKPSVPEYLNGFDGTC